MGLMCGPALPQFVQLKKMPDYTIYLSNFFFSEAHRTYIATYNVHTYVLL